LRLEILIDEEKNIRFIRHPKRHTILFMSYQKTQN